MRQLAPLFGVSPATVCRVIQRMGPQLALEPVARRDEAVDRLWILVIATAPPVPGNRADARVWRESGLAEHCHGVTVLGDGAYINTGLVVPHRKRPGRPLLPGEEEDNAAHRKVRARVEHAFARMKNYKILRDCRQHGNGLHHAVQAVAHMHNRALTA